ncbi:MAG: FecR family protein, partial [Planctomycetaceae bacterium]|nr:FecR family protein [Planctomycetaceae bacterium]
MTDPVSEVEELLLDWEDGSLDQAGIDRLRELLHGNPACRDRYAEFLVLGGLLSHAVTGSAALPASATAVTASAVSPSETAALRSEWSQSSVTRRIAARSLIAMATALLAMLTGRWLYLEFAESEQNIAVAPAVTNEEPRAHGVAVLTRGLDIDWGDHPQFKPGDAIAAGRFQMEAGFAQIEFYCGATVIVEGPADLDLKSPVLAQVRQGRLRAQVPPAARGFTLQLEDLTLVDLGTEFGLSVTDEGTSVQVFDGEVELHADDQPRRLLTAGQAVQHSGQGFQETTVDSHDYLNIERLASRTSDRVNRQFASWRQWSAQVRRDPRLIAYYAFDQTDNWQRRLECSLEPRHRDLDGAIVGARPVAGRWPGKNALEFKRPGDRV